MAGWITARWRRSNSAGPGKLQQGFSLPEMLVALALFSSSLTALMQYHLALAEGFQRQAQQREAWHYALQRFEGYQPAGWLTTLVQLPGAAGCPLFTATVKSPLGRKAQLTLLRCPSEIP
ncbi:prepilin-type N-terminal cleavage/methylation domain-containing protein [Erwinia sp. E_sp_B04_7]|uniref:prepilin-type N-terminal cleavage/methylation domain-containing protein n=2 Tax=Erwinia TaxID=551 RepID=UPI0030D3B467